MLWLEPLLTKGMVRCIAFAAVCASAHRRMLLQSWSMNAAATSVRESNAEARMSTGADTVAPACLMILATAGRSRAMHASSDQIKAAPHSRHS